jgi:hypothetical protein
MFRRLLRAHVVSAFGFFAWLWPAPPAAAQEPGTPQEDHTQHATAAPSGGWLFTQDGVLFATFNHQGGPRGGDEFVVPNWWMGMASRTTRRGIFTLTSMLSLDAALQGKDGYREIFQAGEAVDGAPLIDHQHPHDLFMQLAGSWRIAVTNRTGLTVAAAAAGEPALGPIAFMHRPSAAENPFAPLGHHTFDSTHLAFGAVTLAVDRGSWVAEGSVFNAREPDEDRWDIDFAALNSASGRIWYKPGDRWELQVSTGHLVEPEELEPGDAHRTTASASWFLTEGDDVTAFSAGYGVNGTEHGRRHAVFGEATRRSGPTSVFGRIEMLQVETARLLGTENIDEDRRDVVGAFSVGGVRDVFATRRIRRWHWRAAHAACRTRSTQIDTRFASRFVPGVLPTAPARRERGPDVEYADGPTNGRPSRSPAADAVSAKTPAWAGLSGRLAAERRLF